MAKDLVISIIHLYQHMNRALVQFRFPLVAWTGCRQWPTCSDYAVVAIRERGLARGGYAATRRFLRCNPLIRAA